MSRARDTGKSIGEAFQYIDFFSGKGPDALVRLPYLIFPEYVPDPQRDYQRGEVIRVGNNKYLLQNWGKIDDNNPPRIEGTQCYPPLCKLFRDSGRYDWVREEYCIKGFERYYDDGDPNRTGWYRVITENAGDNNTPPPGVPQTWEKLAE